MSRLGREILGDERTRTRANGQIERWLKRYWAEYEANERLAQAFEDSGVFKPVFTCVPGKPQLRRLTAARKRR